MSLIGVSAIWGETFVMVKDALTETGPLTFLALRFALATLVLLPVLLRRRVLSWHLVGNGAAIGLFLFAGYAFQTTGLQFTSASKAGFITGLSVVLVPLISAVAFGRGQLWERSRAWRWRRWAWGCFRSRMMTLRRG